MSPSSIEEFLLLKTAALFHDPPDKAWCLRRNENHEEWAKELAQEALKDTLLEKAVDMLSDRRVRDADRLAASVDRILLGKLIGNKAGALPERSIKLKNPLYPQIELLDLSQIDVQKDKVVEVMKEINGILKEAENLKEAYFALYGLYELVWIHKGLPSGPADTRIPTHSIFDHLYATAAALNWTYTGDGLLLHIDVRGVQDFIAQSRKLRDLWASSYMVSALIWSISLDFIKDYGPDVVLTPTCRFNPFFYCYLVNKVPKIEVFLRKIKEIKGMEEIVSNEKWPFPRFAIIPGSATFILPFEAFGQDPKKFVEEKFREKWRRFCNGILKLPDMKSLIKILEEKREYGFVDVPPLSIRVSSSHINVYKENNPYLKAFEEISEDRRKKLLKVDPACMLPLTKITKEIFDGRRSPLAESKRGFEYCTMCGRLPAIISMPRRKEYEEKIKEMGIPRTVLGEGEKLCPYCLIKRIFSFRPGLALSEILEYGRDVGLGAYPSLADMATFDLKSSFLAELDALNKLWKENTRVRKLIEEVLEPAKEELKVLQWEYQRRKFEEILGSNIDSDLKMRLLNFLLAESEDVVLEREKRGRWNELRRILRENNVMIKPINTYYALIKADGDSMGDMLGGYICGHVCDEESEECKKELEKHIKDYISNLFEGKSKEIVSKILSGDTDSAREDAKSEELDEKNIDELSRIINEIISKKRIPVSISYHVSISRALMIAALKDIEYVKESKGVVIYAGGDDLLSVAPVSSAIRIIDDTRLAYGGFVREFYGYRTERFYKFNRYYIPSMGNAGRSYSLYIAHYRYPLYEVIKDSAFRLDEIAKESKWVDGVRGRKDSLVITYSPRGSPESSVIPLSIWKPEFTFTDLTLFLRDTVDMILSKKISPALLYEASGGDLMGTARRLWEKMDERNWKDPDLFEESIRYLIKRHLLAKEEDPLNKIMKTIRENKSLKRRSKEDGETPLFIELFKSCRLLYSGLRGG
jgi:CRISPR-associated protein Cmr2